MERRDFLRILGIGGGAAGMTGCSRSAPDSLVPYVIPPEEMVRGHALWFRTTCRECPAGCGVEARVREGRIHKVEGNPEHPVNGGGLCARGQAAVQGLYNPDRLRTPLVQGKAAGWDEALKRTAEAVRGAQALILTGAVSGLHAELAAALGKHVQYEPIAYGSIREANRLVFGIAGLPVLRFADTKTVLLFGADVIETFVSPVGYARGIAEARRAGGRMVYFGPRMSLTGARADEWVPVRADHEGLAAMALVRKALELGGGQTLGAKREQVEKWAAPYTPERAGVPAALITKLASEALARPTLAVAGDCGVFTATAVNLLNAVTGALNDTIRFDRSSALDGVANEAEVDAAIASAPAVLVWGANPVYSSPKLAARLAEKPFVAVMASCPDETTEKARVLLPVHTPLESWGDYEPWRGVHSIQQPAMRPVFDTRDPADVLLTLAGAGKDARTALRDRWRKFAGSREFQGFWQEALQRGGYWEDVPERKAALTLAEMPAAPAATEARYQLRTFPSLMHFDGRGANRPWLQELPDPITQVVWDSWVEIHPEDARKLGVQTGDKLALESSEGTVTAAAYVHPGIREGVLAMPLGQGHTAYGRYATGVGANAAILGRGPETVPVTVSLVSKGRNLTVVAGHDSQEGRGIARARFTPAARETKHEEEPEISIYAEHKHTGNRWAMAVDLDACTACGACIAGCYAENNVPVVGRDQVGRGRHMSWLRVERFFEPGPKPGQPVLANFTLMLCQHCDKAPCETVCPVYASFHNQEGLNGQVYNRCVGTRYCANNCPYKVRRFNWYEADFPAPMDWQLNPDVTARSKGVMEKCTFCVQRITAARDLARREGRPLADGDVTPACAQSCPTKAIVFGDLNDRNSRVAKALGNARRYRVFEELNTRPSVHYLERERRQA